ncbi:M12 family metallopeptidase [Dyadobacter arcticus]|uniref:Peptidase M12A domain-containing protein n=1 Tax=Dyadobacter arcticus TaxID=1078754 RepID=A0ABX0UHN5_9BACT|nr:M12 family metallopeptidase [Dyadobacter arcticus]NIJ52466.1 hypothetical protein [Dyadobacter arcticus]
MKGMHLLSKTSLVLCVALSITSCREMQPENEVATAAESAINRIAPEVAYPGEQGVLKQGTLFGNEITYTEIDNKAVFEGDIILSPQQLRGTSNARTEAVTMYTSLWPNNTISYTIDASIANKETILAAIADVEASTPIRFVAKRGTVTLPGSNPPLIEPSYVTFTGARGYSSSIGRVGGQQFITMPISATKGGILHEIGHTVGLLHEHTRSDRASTIKVNLANVADADKPNLMTINQSGKAAIQYGQMDMGSIMMLDSYAYSKNGLPVMTYLDGSTFSVQRNQFSTNDIGCITAMYSNLYAANALDVFASDVISGNKSKYPSHYTSVEAMYAIPGIIFIGRGPNIMKLNTDTGEGTALAYEFNGVKGMVYSKGYVYALQNGYLWKIEVNTGSKQKLGGQYWVPGTAISYAYGFLFIVNGDNLFRVSMDGLSFLSMGTGYKGVTELAALKDQLYVVKNQGRLYKINPMTGVTTTHGSDIFGTGAQLTSSGKNLLVNSMGKLYNVDEAGTIKLISNNWSDMTHLAAADAGN